MLYFLIIFLVSLSLSCMEEYSIFTHNTESKKFKKDNIWWAAGHGDQKTVKWWVKEKGKEILDLEDEQGNTPLIWATTKGKIEAMEYIFKAHPCVKVNVTDTFKRRTALQWVVRMSEGSINKGGQTLSKEIVQKAITILVQHKADIALEDNEDHAASYWIKRLNLPDKDRENLLKCLEQ